MKTKKGLRVIGYLMVSQTPWIRGKNVTEVKPTPSCFDSSHYANAAIIKAMRNDAR